MMERGAILYWVLREGLIDEVMSEQRPEWNKEPNRAMTYVK